VGAEDVSRSFLRTLWPNEPLPGSLVVWTKSREGKKTSSWCTTLDQAAAVAAQYCRSHDLYFGVALQGPDAALSIARQKHPAISLRSVRGSSNSTTAIPGLWMDIDIKAPAHSQADLPPDLPAALSLLEVVPYEATVLVNSGFGLHAYWLFREPWVFESAGDRREAQRLVRRLQTSVRAEAAGRGWKLDGTGDLARVLRLPGTYNHKPER
jgi:hypothetical protein